MRVLETERFSFHKMVKVTVIDWITAEHLLAQLW